MTAPKISVVMNTHNELYPMPGRDKDIFTVLIDALKDQTFQDFELIIVDRLFEERKDTFSKLKLPFPFKYMPPKPSPWWKAYPIATTISSDRNSGIMLAGGELIFCLDDCVIPSHSYLLGQVWECWEKEVLLRPLTFNYDYRQSTVKITPDALIGWLETQEKREFHEVSGKAMGNYLLPATVWESINGFDERYDGAYGSEDSDVWERVDRLGVKRYVLSENQHHLALIWHDHPLRDFRGTVHHVCNYAYAHWTYDKIHNHDMIQANVRILEPSDLEEIKLSCRVCPVTSMCKPKEPWGLEHYLEFQSVFDLADVRKEMLKEYGDVYGVLRPWEKDNGKH